MKAKQTKDQRVLQKTIRRHLRLAVIPHKANHYRPHLVRRYGLVVVALLILACNVGYNFMATGEILGDKTVVTSQSLLSDTNSERTKHQLPPLQLDSKLSQAAFLKAKDMFKQQYWSHTAPDGTTPWQWFGDVDYNYAYAGENLAKNFVSSGGAVAAWMASPEHKANIVNRNYTDVGFAVVDGVLNAENTRIIVALYGAPASGGIAGIQAPASITNGRSMGLMTRLGVTIQSMSPAILGSMAMLLFVAGVALSAHAYRKKLPKQLYDSWYRHHGAAKAGGVLVVCLIIAALYSSGQI